MLVLAASEPGDAAALLAFELANRAFFEAHINARPAAYYSLAGVAHAIQVAIDDAAADRGYQFLVKSGDGAIVGRVNLRNVQRGHFHSAVLGYRFAEAQGRKGHASAAVGAVLDIAFGRLQLLHIRADARHGNAASVRVLERNGFVQLGVSRCSYELNGVLHDHLHFERHAG